MKTIGTGLSLTGVIIPDGRYNGKISGYEVSFIYASSVYKFTTENGIRGIDIPCEITIRMTPEGEEISVETK